MEKVFSDGQMVEYIKEIISKIRSTDLGEYNGLMVKFTKVNGKRECNTVRENTKAKMEYGEKVIGRTEKESDEFYLI